MKVECPKCGYRDAESVSLFTTVEIRCDLCTIRKQWQEQVESVEDLPSFRMPVILDGTVSFTVTPPDAEGVQVGAVLYVRDSEGAKRFISDGSNWHQI